MELINIIHDSYSDIYRKPFGAVKIGTKVNLAIKINRRGAAFLNIINFYNNRIEIGMRECKSDEYDQFYYEIEIDTKDFFGVNYYYFRIEVDGQNIFYGNNNECLGGVGQVFYSDPKFYQITVHNVSDIPQWYKKGVIYQIFVDRFYNGNEDGKILNPKKNTFIYGNWYDNPMYIKDNNGNVIRWDFYGGNLLGVRKKLEYLKSLGINIIYFNPIFESSSCHKYDTGDYEIIDRMFGTNEEFKKLCEEAEALGIRVILDGVFSHTGADSKYFNKFDNYTEVGAFQSLQSKYYGWYKFNDYPNLYQCWWGVSNMPEVDEMNPTYLKYIIKDENSIVEKWLKLGASGWRLDVADELPDKFIKLLKQKLKEVKPEGVLIGEVWEDASNKISYSSKREYLFGYELDSVMNYPLRQVILDYAKRYINAEYFIRRYKSIQENYPTESFYSTMNMIGNHDTERVLTIVNKNTQLLKLVVSIQMTLPGVPVIYYGDEAGLTGGKDPDNRKPYPWKKENKEILEYYKKIVELRNKENVLIDGAITFKESVDNILCYERSKDDVKIIVIANSSEKRQKYKLKGNMNKNIENLISNEKIYISTEDIVIDLEANECKILKLI